MPKYSRFQYAIKKYGQFESNQNQKKKLFLLKGRIGIRSGNELRYVYSSSPIKISGKRQRFRIRTNTGAQITTSTIVINGNLEKIRMRETQTNKQIISTRGWG
ncbi:hypothetical protein I4L69_001646 [Enterococcus faecium]|nr:hypothetical protein [Enterococcus faecium]